MYLPQRLWKLLAILSILNSSETPRTVYYAEFLQLWLATLHAIFVRIVVKKYENYYFSRQDLIYFTFDKLPHWRVPLKTKFYWSSSGFYQTIKKRQTKVSIQKNKIFKKIFILTRKNNFSKIVSILLPYTFKEIIHLAIYEGINQVCYLENFLKHAPIKGMYLWL
jgi:hypothetical protein